MPRIAYQERTLVKDNSDDIAVILPAHNEEKVIKSSIEALCQVFHPYQIYVVSDGSSDKTAEIARLTFANVMELNPGLGKAKALVYTIKKQKLFSRYKYIFIMDADTRMDKNFVSRGLEILRDPDISAVFAAPMIDWDYPMKLTRAGYFIAYRERLNMILRYLLLYGQTWKYTNTNYVIPGFCTIYRSSVLKKIKLDEPGLLIEDFNTAFQLHKKKLGKIGFEFGLYAWDQHPDNLKDYWNQVRRWNIGFFQTVRKNGVWPSFFWVSLALFTYEVFASSVFMALLPFVLLGLAAPYIPASIPLLSDLAWIINTTIPGHITVATLYALVILFDYLISVMLGIIHRRPEFIVYGPFFIFMHYVTSLILMTSLIPGFFTSSSGRWISPTRREEHFIPQSLKSPAHA